MNAASLLSQTDSIPKHLQKTQSKQEYQRAGEMEVNKTSRKIPD